jgi:hypothetical protein
MSKSALVKDTLFPLLSYELAGLETHLTNE